MRMSLIPVGPRAVTTRQAQRYPSDGEIQPSYSPHGGSRTHCARLQQFADAIGNGRNDFRLLVIAAFNGLLGLFNAVRPDLRLTLSSLD